jgi:hypothetical protein
MTLYRLKLHTLACHSPRSQAPYNDFVIVNLLAMRGSEVIGMVESPLGSFRKNRGAVGFGPGATYTFGPESFWRGAEKDWEVVFDLSPELEDVSLRVLVTNGRGIGDPYALARFLTVALVTGGTLGISLAFGKELKEVMAKILSDEGLRKAVLSVAKQVPGEIFDELTDWLFGAEWPECTGSVYERRWTLNSGNIADLLGTHDEGPDDGFQPSLPGECRKPSYSLGYSITPEAVFPAPEKPDRSRYVPWKPGRSTDWEGAWADSFARSISVDIRHLANGRREYQVSPREQLPSGALVVPAASFSPVAERYGRTPPFVADQVPVASPYANAPTARPADALDESPSTVRAGAVRGLGTRVTEANMGGPASATTAPAPSPGSPGSTGSPVPPASKLPDASEFIPEDPAPKSLQAVRQLQLPEHGIVLGLYELVEEFSGGRWKRSGPFVRYQRPGNMAATSADVMLWQVPELG